MTKRVVLWRGDWFRFVLAFTLALASQNVFAACRSESRVLAMNLGQTARSPMNSGIRFTRAGYYLDAGCLRQARAELDLSNAALSREGLDKSDMRTRQRAQDALRSYVDALQLLEDGRRQAAVEKMLGLLDTSRSTDVMWKVTTKLGDLLVLQSTPEEWERFSQSLNQLNSSEAKFWQVDLFRRLKDVRDGRGQSAISALGEELSQELPIQRSLSLKVILAEVLVADGRYANARVQCSFVDEDVGEGLLDIELRLRYLRACSIAWNRAPAGADSEVSSRAQRIFDAAIAKFEDQL